MLRDLPTDPEVVIVGGGIAALEAVLALHDLTDAQARVTLIAPHTSFGLKPLEVARPFAAGHSERVPLAAVLHEHGGRFLCDAAAGVDPAARTVVTDGGLQVGYDVLLLAVGARPLPAYDGVLTFGPGADPAAFGGLLADLEQGYCDSAAFVVPAGCTWPLPLYELALMTAREVAAMGRDVALHLVTPEPAPLAVFGPEPAAAVAELLAEAGVTLHTGCSPDVVRHREVLLGDDRVLKADRIVALPRLHGAAVPGLPVDAAGFLPVDEHQRVIGLEDVYAAGDATDRPIKQGGMACQQADAAVVDIARRTGVSVAAFPQDGVLRGRLLTGGTDRYLRRAPGDGRGEADATPLWWPPAKVHSRYLGPWLAARDLVHLPGDDAAAHGIDVALPV